MLRYSLLWRVSGVILCRAGGNCPLAAWEQFLNRLSWGSRQASLAAIALAIILAGVFLLYAPTLSDPFHGDDFVAFTEFMTKSFFDYSRDVFLFKDTNFYWRPLGSIFHYALYAGFGLDPFVYHFAALLFFLATLVCLYLFCLGENLGKLTALGSALIFGIYSNHVVSVSWVTNTSRVASGLFVMVCLLLIQRARTSRRAFLWETAALLAFTVAALNDETTTALAPVPFLYGTFLARRSLHLRGAAARLIVYGALVAVIVPLQFTYTIDDEARLTQYGLGPHVLTSVWVLASQLTLPLASGSPVAVMIQLVGPAQWAAGLVILFASALAFLSGSRPVKFLVVWIGLAFAPFALWEPQDISPRYVYLAAMPFAILASWSCVRLISCLRASIPGHQWPSRALRLGVPAAALAVSAAVAFLSINADKERNAAWSKETAKYGVLRTALEDEFPAMLPGTRLIVLYGEWPDFWASSVARTVFGDPSLWVTSIPRERVDQAEIRTQPNDILVYMLGDRLMSVNTRR